MTIDHLHHVGHVVRDIDAAIALYRRMGFAVPPPAFPALPPHPGAPLRAFGVGNSHVNFRSSFVELVTVVDDREGGVVGTDATLVPLQALLRSSLGCGTASRRPRIASPPHSRASQVSTFLCSARRTLRLP